MRVNISKDWCENAAKLEDGSDVQAGELARLPEFCDPLGHDWKEEYYGHRCAKCDLFYAFGCAPWDEPHPDLD